MSYIAYGKIKDGAIHFENEEGFALFLEANKGRKVYVDIGFETRQRTLPQNNSLHLGCDLMAKALNDAGLEIKVVLAKHQNVPWSGELVKELIIRPVMKAMYQKSSTTMLTKEEPGELWEVVMRELGEKHGLEFIPFPSKETKNEAFTIKKEK